MTAAFDDIYRRNAWNGVESLSGPGSGRAATWALVPDLLALVDELQVASVLDVGCGDGFWMPDLPGYIGIDPVPQAIDQAQLRHPNRDYRVGLLDITPVPSCDLVISRDAMQHLPLADAVALLAAIRSTGSTWLLASTYSPGDNRDVPAGGYYEPDLSAWPFAMGPPDRLIFDGYDYGQPGVHRDPRKYLGLWRLL